MWTNFAPGRNRGFLDWYTVLIGVLALAALVVHGALWVRYKTAGELSARAEASLDRVWWLVGILTLAATAASFVLQPSIFANFSAYPWGAVFPLLAIAGFLGMRQRGELAAFLCSCAYLVGMLTSAAFGIFPYVLPSASSPGLGLTIYNAAPAVYGLQIGLAWWIPGMALAAGYSVFVYRRFAGKVS